MKASRKYDIDIINLSNETHDYEYVIDSSFFQGFEGSYIEKGNLNVKVALTKSETLLMSSFHIDGIVGLICDRSLEPFDYEIKTSNNLIFKYGDDYVELTDEIVTIPHNAQKINVAQYIYEFIGLAVPMKKLHPKFKKEEDEFEEADTILIYSTTSETEGEEEDKDEIDPRWDILNKLKKNNN